MSKNKNGKRYLNSYKNKLINKIIRIDYFKLYINYCSRR